MTCSPPASSNARKAAVESTIIHRRVSITVEDKGAGAGRAEVEDGGVILGT